MTEFISGGNGIRVVVLGGCGFIGRNLVDHFITNNLVSHLRVVDKTPPQLAWLNHRQQKIFEDPRVEYHSANLINPSSCAAALDCGEEEPWTIVVNCAGETRGDQPEPVYQEGIYRLSTNVIKESIQIGVRRFVEISSGQLYNSEKIAHNEDGPIEPWTREGRWKVKVEEELRNHSTELNYTILRPGLVYGIGDRRSLTPRLLLGAIYKYLQEPMKLLWTGDMNLNTVHVKDVCRAVWYVSMRSDTINKIYNIVDDANSTQGTLANFIAEIFNIEHGYYGTTVSNLAKSDIAAVAEEANDKHLTAWGDICRDYKLAHTPLEPSMASELLLNRHLHLDGFRLRSLGFTYEIPQPSVGSLKEVLQDYAQMYLFPKGLLP